MTLERLWAGWRSEYVTTAGQDEGCVLCRILASGDDRAAHVVWRGERCAAVLNAFPYTSGHLMVMPVRHAAELEDLDTDEASELWAVVTDAVRALKAAYDPGGINIGFNLGLAAGAGVPGHLHAHALPRWSGDTNFMTAAAEARVLPESLTASHQKLEAAWPR